MKLKMMVVVAAIVACGYVVYSSVTDTAQSTQTALECTPIVEAETGVVYLAAPGCRYSTRVSIAEGTKGQVDSIYAFMRSRVYYDFRGTDATIVDPKITQTDISRQLEVTSAGVTNLLFTLTFRTLDYYVAIQTTQPRGLPVLVQGISQQLLPVGQ